VYLLSLSCIGQTFALLEGTCVFLRMLVCLAVYWFVRVSLFFSVVLGFWCVGVPTFVCIIVWVSRLLEGSFAVYVRVGVGVCVALRFEKLLNTIRTLTHTHTQICHSTTRPSCTSPRRRTKLYPATDNTRTNTTTNTDTHGSVQAHKRTLTNTHSHNCKTNTLTKIQTKTPHAQTNTNNHTHPTHKQTHLHTERVVISKIIQAFQLFPDPTFEPEPGVCACVCACACVRACALCRFVCVRVRLRMRVRVCVRVPCVVFVYVRVRCVFRVRVRVCAPFVRVRRLCVCVCVCVFCLCVAFSAYGWQCPS